MNETPETMPEMCFVCLTAPAVSRVTVEKTTEAPMSYPSCEGCEPRHIPQGDIVLIRVTALPPRN